MQQGSKSRADCKIALLITVALRVFYSGIAALFSTFSHPDPALIHSNALTANLPAAGTLHYALLGIWERFDTLWYLHIAQHGYDRREAVAFYPLYPALIRTLGPLTSDIGASLLISTVSSFFLFWGLLRLLRTEAPDQQPFRGLALFAAWPASFILFAGYTEALAIALVLWCILFAREERWGAAAACGFAAGLTRSMGILLIVPLAMLAWKSRRSSRGWIAVVPLGTLAYWTWLRATGRPSVVAAYHYWNTDIVPPWTTLWRTLQYLLHHPDTLVVLNLSVLIFITLAAVIARRRTEDRAFSAALIFQVLMRACVPPLAGAFRYVLPVYPAYLTMGNRAQTMKRSHFVFVCGALFIFNLVWIWEFLNWSLVL